MTSILNHYIHDDGSIALFNGANNNYQKQILEITHFIKLNLYAHNYNYNKRIQFVNKITHLSHHKTSVSEIT